MHYSICKYRIFKESVKDCLIVFPNNIVCVGNYPDNSDCRLIRSGTGRNTL
jgi:hypothetical protein